MPIWVNRQGRWKMQYNGRMKTKPLTFLLALVVVFHDFYTFKRRDNHGFNQVQGMQKRS